MNPIITDTLGLGLTLTEKMLGDSLKIIVGSTPLDESLYKVAYDDSNPSCTIFTIEFLGYDDTNPMKDTVTIQYSAMLDPGAARPDPKNPDQYLVTNEARLDSEAITKWDTEEKPFFTSSSSGSASGKEIARLIIQKVDSGSNQALQGAKFQLLDQAGNIVHSNLVTSSTGSIGPLRLKRAVYTLVEVEAPSGYPTPSGDAARFTIDLTTGNKTLEYVVKNTKQTTSSTPPTSSRPPSPSSNPTDPSQPPVTSSGPTISTPPISSPSISSPSSRSTTSNRSRPPASRSRSTSSRSRSTASSGSISTTVPTPTDPGAPGTTGTPGTPPTPVTPGTGAVGPAGPATGTGGTTPTATPGGDTTPDDADDRDPDLDGLIEPDNGEGSETLPPNEVPLANPNEGAAWSLLNLIMSLISLFAGIVLLISMLRRRGQNQSDAVDETDVDDGDQQPASSERNSTQRKRLLGLRIPAMLLGLVPGILFLILEDIRLPMTWVTQWSPIIGAVFIIHMVLLLVHYVITKRAKDSDSPDDDNDDMGAQPV